VVHQQAGETRDWRDRCPDPGHEDASRSFDVTADEREDLLQLARDARKRGWWHAYGGAIPTWFAAYVGFEDEAASIRTYEIQLIPGLLQTPEYARALIEAHRPEVTPEGIEAMITARIERQSVLTKPNPLQLWAIIDEAAITRLVGGSQIMRAQLAHLEKMGHLPNVTVQVLTAEAGAHASMGTSFALLEFPEPADPDVVYLEDLTSSAYLENERDIQRYNLVFDHLRSTALPDSASTAWITQAAEDWPRTRRPDVSAQAQPPGPGGRAPAVTGQAATASSSLPPPQMPSRYETARTPPVRT